MRGKEHWREAVRDGVLNEWDMDKSTTELETNGTWTFGMNPEGAAEPYRDFTEACEVVVAGQ